MSDRLHIPPCSAQLDREWARLRRHRRSIRTVRSWAPGVEADLAPTLRSTTDLVEIVRATQRDAGERGERLLLALVELSATEQLAGRIIVQRLLPGLIAASMPYRDLAGEHDPVQLAVGALWLSIRQYDHERRRRHVAASLISDATYRAFRQPLRRRSTTEDACPPARFDELDARDGVDPLVELAAALDEARRAGVPADDLRLLRTLVQVGAPSRLAADLEVTPRTIRNRRDRAVRRVRDAIGERPARVA